MAARNLPGNPMMTSLSASWAAAKSENLIPIKIPTISAVNKRVNADNGQPLTKRQISRRPQKIIPPTDGFRNKRYRCVRKILAHATAALGFPPRPQLLALPSHDYHMHVRVIFTVS